MDQITPMTGKICPVLGASCAKRHVINFGLFSYLPN